MYMIFTMTSVFAIGEGGSSAYLTYYNYFAGQPLTQVSCSDGANGLMTRWGYSTIDPMAPYVAAVSNVVWNSPNCGKCYKVTASTGNSIYVTAIDHCAPVSNYAFHFDLHPNAFSELFGSLTQGVGTGTVTEVASSNCRGNKG
jgi:hypothetical protein